jgi:hypothetical protein
VYGVFVLFVPNLAVFLAFSLQIKGVCGRQFFPQVGALTLILALSSGRTANAGSKVTSKWAPRARCSGPSFGPVHTLATRRASPELNCLISLRETTSPGSRFIVTRSAALLHYPAVRCQRAASSSMSAITVNRKVQRTAEIDMREVRRPQPPQPVVVNSLSFALPVIKRGLHALRVPRNYQVCQQRQRAGYCNHFVAAPSALRRDLAGIDRALQLMNGFTVVKQRMHFATKLQVAKIIAQE